jgi:hypothetical protein
VIGGSLLGGVGERGVFSLPSWVCRDRESGEGTEPGTVQPRRFGREQRAGNPNAKALCLPEEGPDKPPYIKEGSVGERRPR